MGSSEAAVAVRAGGGARSVHGWLALVARLVLGGLFLFAASSKLKAPFGPQLFAGSVKAFKVPFVNEHDWLVQFTTFAVPWVEVIAGVALIAGLFTRAAAVVLNLLLVLFIALVIQALARDLNVKCGCFGEYSPLCGEKVGWCNVYQNLALFGLGMIVITCKKHPVALERMLSSKSAA